MKRNFIVSALCIVCFLLANNVSAQLIKPDPVSGKTKTVTAKEITTSEPLEQAETLPIQQYLKLKEIFKQNNNGASPVGEVPDQAENWWTPTAGGNDSHSGHINNKSLCVHLKTEISNKVNTLTFIVARFETQCGPLTDKGAEGMSDDCKEQWNDLVSVTHQLSSLFETACDYIATGKCSLSDISGDSNVQQVIQRNCN